MITLQCKSCGGIYTDVGNDGVRYFHVCGPLSVVEIAAAVQAGRVVLPQGETLEDAIRARTYKRANTRDERPPSIRSADAGKLTSAGAGVDELEAPPRAVVTVA